MHTGLCYTIASFYKPSPRIRWHCACAQAKGNLNKRFHHFQLLLFAKYKRPIALDSIYAAWVYAGCALSGCLEGDRALKLHSELFHWLC